MTAVEARLAALFDHLSLARVHLAGRASIDWLGFASAHPERIASLMLLCPQVLEPAALLPLGARVLVVAGDEGRGAARVRAALRLLPEATARILPGYTGLSWSDLAGDRGDAIGPAIEDFIDRADPLPAAGLPAQEGEVAGISYRVRGAGPPLVLLPLELSPGQWEPLIPFLTARYCTVTLGGAELGAIANLEERGRSAYMDVVRGFLDKLAIKPGDTVVEVGCGSGVIMRELARRTAGANRLIGRDMNPYFLHEARQLARREGVDRLIELGEGDAHALPLPDATADVALSSTVFEEGDADLMLAELVRVTKPGGRVGVIVRAVDMPCWVNLPLGPALKAKAEAPGVIGGGVSPGGCADASLYRRFHVAGLRGVDYYPQLVAVKPWQRRLARYQEQVLAILTEVEATAWRAAAARAEADGTFFIAQGLHCAIGTKPG